MRTLFLFSGCLGADEEEVEGSEEYEVLDLDFDLVGEALPLLGVAGARA